MSNKTLNELFEQELLMVLGNSDENERKYNTRNSGTFDSNFKK